MSREGIRNAAQKFSTRPQRAPDLLESKMRVHQVLEGLKTDNHVEGVVGKWKSIGTDIQTEGLHASRQAALNSGGRSIDTHNFQTICSHKFQHGTITTSDLKRSTKVLAGKELRDSPLQTAIVITTLGIVFPMGSERNFYWIVGRRHVRKF
jgi:hypothetical protein